ncbi:YwiC-like family protein [Nocardioides taihuensis]|uniref:YwiC-like family protein n=1 Tax=Nocardioides taihuensis TaxID=1835606 RepID=A0ABW0BDV9_9ACTN
MSPGSSTAGAPSSGSAAPRRRRDAVVPPQHGAWAFLALPLVVGAVVAPAAARSWWVDLVVLGVAWVAAYPLTWAVAGRLAAPRPERFDRPLRIWAGVFALPALVSFVWHPWLWVPGAVLAALFGVNLLHARRRAERSLTNDAVLVLECALVVPVVAGLGAPRGDWNVPWDRVLEPHVLLAALLCALTLGESTLHVRSYLRERANPAFGRLADGAAVASVAVATALALAWGGSDAWLLVLPYVWCVVRAFLQRARAARGVTLRPARLGLLELVGFGALAVAVALAG